MRVDIGYRRLYFDVEGSGMVPDGPRLRTRPTLIALHGAPGFSDHATFKPAFRPLAEDMQVIYLDLCGAGRSDPVGEGQSYSLELWANELVRFCEVLGIEKPIVLGVSGGGFVAQRYAIHHPDHAAGVVFACTQAKLIPERAIAMFEKLGGAAAGTAARSFLTGPYTPEALAAFSSVCMPLYNPTPANPDAGRRMRHRPELARAFHEFPTGIWHTMDLLDELDRVRCPVLVMAGELDPITPVEDSLDIVARLDPKIVQLEVMTGCGHGCWRDKPEESLALIRDFVLRHAGV
jgi:proline iminopeptidase